MSKWIKYELDSLKEENPYLPFRKEFGGKGILLRDNVYLGGSILPKYNHNVLLPPKTLKDTRKVYFYD